MDNKAATMPRLAALGLGILSVVLLLIALTDSFAEPDLWGYLNFGRLFFSEPGFPMHDTFAYVPTNLTWVFHEWLTGVFLFRLQEALGQGGIQILKYLLGGLTMLFLAATARQRGAGGIRPLIPIFLAGAFFSWAFPSFRALCFTYCFFSLFLFLLETARIKENFARLWLLAPVMLLWASLHGGFLAGLGLIFLYAIGQAIEGRRFFPYLKILAICSLITLINPYGYHLWGAILGHLSEPQHGIKEWVSVPGALTLFGPSYDLLIFLSCLGMTLGLIILNGFRDKTALLVFGATALIGLIHHRNMPFLILVFMAFAPSLLSCQFSKPSFKNPGRALTTAVTLFFAMAMLTFSARFFVNKIQLVIHGGNPLSLKTPSEPYDSHFNALFYPVHAVDYLETTGFSGNILPYATWGGYISWRLYPRCKVAMDLRFETVYPKEVRDEYFDFLRCGNGWRLFLNKYPHDAILTYYGDKLYKALSKESGWQEVYRDAYTAIFTRRGLERPSA